MTRSGCLAAYATAIAAPCETPSSTKRSKPAASITASRSPTHVVDRELPRLPPPTDHSRARRNARPCESRRGDRANDARSGFPSPAPDESARSRPGPAAGRDRASRRQDAHHPAHGRSGSQPPGSPWPSGRTTNSARHHPRLPIRGRPSTSPEMDDAPAPDPGFTHAVTKIERSRCEQGQRAAPTAPEARSVASNGG